MPLDTRTTRWWVLYAVIGVLAFGSRLLLVLRGGGLLGVGGYDDGVYYAAAAAFVHGRMPYADFLFIQPPGVVLAGAPFAWFGSVTTDAVGFATAHIAFMAVGATSAVLVTAILRRFGFVAAATGGLAYAVAYVAVYAERSILLEPFGTLGILIALFVLSRPALRGRTWWLIGAGFALGAATGFKIWYVVPAIVIIAWSGRAWWRMLVGAVIGGCAVYLPFFVANPSKAFGEIVMDQLGRGGSTPSLGSRVHMILGDYEVPHFLAFTGLNRAGLTIIMAIVALVVVVLAVTVRRAWLYVALFGIDAIVLLTAPSFFLHYTALTSPMLALVFGVAVGRAVELMRSRRVGMVLVSGVAAAVVAVNLPFLVAGTGEAPVQASSLQRQASSVNGCVIADDPTMLAVANVLSSDLARGCPLWPDVTGYTYGPARELTAAGKPVARVRNASWQRTVVGYLTSGSAVILARRDTGLSAASHRIVAAGATLYREPGVVLVLRSGVQAG